jgi:anti-anti-sigma factor
VSELARVEAADLDDARLVRVSGEIDLSNARDVMEAICGAVPHDASLVVVDLSETAYLDSSGIAMIFRLAERLSYSRQELRLVVPADAPIRAVLELTSLHQVVPVQDAIIETPDPT